MKAKRGFTLIEMLVVIGILAVLIGAGLTSFSAMTKKAQKANGQELVSNVATALTALYQQEGAWPRRYMASATSDGEFTPENAYELAKRNLVSLTYDSSKKKTISNDRCGIVTPWAQKVLKGSTSAGEGTKVSGGGTVADHRLHFAIDDDGDGYVDASVFGESVKIRATAAVWSCGSDGKKEAYSTGVRHNGIYSWNRGQVKR